MLHCAAKRKTSIKDQAVEQLHSHELASELMSGNLDASKLSLLKLAEGPFYLMLPVILSSPVKRIPARFDSLSSLCPLQMPF
jgi:hypothetical protein